MPKNQGELKSYTPSWSDQLAYWLADNWYGSDREGVRKAKRAVDVMRMTPLDLPLTGDEVARDLDTGQYKSAGIMAALGLLPGRTPAIHISPNRFEKFSMKHMGSGEGTQNEGLGLYFMGDNENPMVDSYASAFTRYGLIDSETGAAANSDDVYQELLNMGKNISHSKAKDKAAEWANSLIGALNNPQYGSVFEQSGVPGELMSLADRYKPIKTGPHRYDVELGFDSSSVPELGKHMLEQPYRLGWDLGDMVNQLYDPSKISETITTRTRGPEWKTEFSWPHQGRESYPLITGYGLSKDESIAAALDQIDKYKEEAQTNPVYHINNFWEKQAPLKFKERGIGAIKYDDPDTGDEFKNYVVFDEKLIKLLKRTALAVPGLLGAIGIKDAMENSDGKQVR